MTPLSKEFIMIAASAVVAIAILATAWFANGSEYEDAWLYIFCVWLVVSPLLDLYFKKKDKEE